MVMMLYLPMMKLQINFKCFALHLSHVHSKKMRDQMEINWHLVKFLLFIMQYIHPLDTINNEFMSSHIKNKKVWPYQWTQLLFQTQKRDFPQGSFLRSLTQPGITRQRNFELTDIEYDLINDELARIEHVG